jgi:hypothetical protein
MNISEFLKHSLYLVKNPKEINVKKYIFKNTNMYVMSYILTYIN